MSDASSPPGTAATRIEEESSGVQERAQEMAGRAEEKAQEAAGRAQGMLREQVDQRSTEAGERISGAAEDLRSVGEELRKQGKESSAKIAERAAERTASVGTYLRESDADRVLGDVEELGRRQPLAVLVGGLALGIAAARFLKASSRSRYRGRFEVEQRTRELGVPGRGTAPTPESGGKAATAPAEAPLPPAPAVHR